MSGLYKGDLAENQDLDFKFLSVDPSTGAPATLSGTPVISVYKDNSTTQTTTGVTLTVDFDGLTGLNHVRIVTTAAFYAVATDYQVVITTGTSGGVSAVGTPVADFSIENRFNEVDVAKWLGTAVATPTVAGVPEVDVTHVSGVAEDIATETKQDTAQSDLDLITGPAGALLDSTATSAKLVDDIWDESLTGLTHNVANSAGRRLRNLQEFGWYDNGSIYIDTVDGSAGTTDYENGTYLNPVNTLADAITLATSLNLDHFHMSNDSSITFAEAHTSERWIGEGWELNLNGQDISQTHIYHCNEVSGVATATTGECHIIDSHVGNITIGESHFTQCNFAGTFTINQAAQYVIDDCGGEQSTAFVIDMGAAVGASTVFINNWHDGSITINNLAAGDLVKMSGIFEDVILNGADAQVDIVGIAGSVTNNLTGSPTVNDNTIKADAMLSAAQVNAEMVDVLFTDAAAELSAVPAANASLADKLTFLAMLARNKGTQTATEKTLFADDESTSVGVASVSTDGTTFTKGEYT